jgi:hypothetical protein
LLKLTPGCYYVEVAQIKLKVLNSTINHRENNSFKLFPFIIGFYFFQDCTKQSLLTNL